MPGSRRTRPARVAVPLALLLVGLVAGLLTGCGDDTGDPDDGWDPDAQFAPSLRPAFGVRADDDGRLLIWTGSPCQDITRLALAFEPSGDELVLVPRDETADVERLVLGAPYRGLRVEHPVGAGFDWTEALQMRISVHGTATAWGSTADLATVREESAEHPGDTYYFTDVGWLDPDEVAAEDGETFLATCTPDPARG